ncbi:MAG: hypothetical protein EOM24_05340 [Chloroflexia bacterium]|nr:hypothetical protein [Chloroflexia bacterium]
MRTNYILIDYENVQPLMLPALAPEYFEVRVFLGANQTKIPFEIVAALQKMGPRAEYIKVGGQGSNALDFHIAFYLGQIAAYEPQSYFHIISNDTGFDPLIQHLRAQKLFVYRCASLGEIPIIRLLSASALSERVTLVKNHFQQRKVSLPRTIKTLSNTIHHFFLRMVSDEEVEAILHQLLKEQFIVLKEQRVEYAAFVETEAVT